MKENNISFKKFLPGLAWFFVVAILTLMPGSNVPEVRWLKIPFLDKFVHVALFGGLTLFFCLPYLKSPVSLQKKRNIFIRISLCVVVWGLIIEVIQKHFIKGRGFEWMDVVADTVGVIIAYLLCQKLAKFKKFQDKIPFF